MVNASQRYGVYVLQSCEPINENDWQHTVYFMNKIQSPRQMKVIDFQSSLGQRPLSGSRVAKWKSVRLRTVKYCVGIPPALGLVL